MDVPRVEDAQLVLRGWQEHEFDRMAEIYADPEVGRFIGGGRSVGASWDAFLRNIGTWAQYGYGMWAVELKDSGALVGQVGFARRRRGLGPAFDAAPEAGWTLAQEAQGRGIGRAAVALMHGWFDAHVGGPAVAQVALENAASRALAARAGYTVYDETDEVFLLRRG